jgi:hypothetical protein
MTSKFAGLKEMRQRRSEQSEVGENAEITAATSSVPAPRSEAGPTPLAAKKMGRPPGKRSNPEYQQVTVLLHSAIYTEARKRLLDERKDVSDLINELLDGWLKL